MRCKCGRCRYDLKDGAWLFQCGDATDEDALVDLGFLVGVNESYPVYCPACGTGLLAGGGTTKEEAA